MTERPVYVPPLKAATSPWDYLLIGLVVLSAVAAAFTAAREYKHHRAVERVVMELRSARSAFREYMQLYTIVPGFTNFGEAPKTEAPFLAQLRWSKPTPAGGYYQWLGGVEPTSKRGGIATGRLTIAAFPPAPPVSLSKEDWLEVDRQLDDGDLSSGDFRTGFNDWPVLTLRAKP